jgi:hypothetical protein
MRSLRVPELLSLGQQRTAMAHYPAKRRPQPHTPAPRTPPPQGRREGGCAAAAPGRLCARGSGERGQRCGCGRAAAAVSEGGGEGGGAAGGRGAQAAQAPRVPQPRQVSAAGGASLSKQEAGVVAAVAAQGAAADGSSALPLCCT